jgi:DNA-binding response OmpR family regulator
VAAALNVVIVEDHDILREVTANVLRAEGHHVVALSCAEALDDEGAGRVMDVLVVDLGLPGEDGLSLSRRVREAQPLVGIVMMTARTDMDERVAGYASGADIYLPKPVHPRELVAAVAALGRRLNTSQTLSGATPAEGFRLDPSALTFTGPQGAVPVTSVEATLLAALARAPGRQLATWQLFELLGEDLDSYARPAFEMRIGRLRKRLVSAGAPANAVRAVRGVGYQLCMPLIVA